jgi:hypothetical protein
MCYDKKWYRKNTKRALDISQAATGSDLKETLHNEEMRQRETQI